MPIEFLVFGLWVAALFLVVWQAVLTVQLQRLRTGGDGRPTTDVNAVGLGMLYNGLIDELRQTADDKIGLLEQRIDELEALLERHERLVDGGVIRPATFGRQRLRRCG